MYQTAATGQSMWAERSGAERADFPLCVQLVEVYFCNLCSPLHSRIQIRDPPLRALLCSCRFFSNSCSPLRFAHPTSARSALRCPVCSHAALLSCDGHWREAGGWAWPRRDSTTESLHLHQLAAQSRDLGPLQFDDLALLVQFQLQQRVLVGGRCRDERIGRSTLLVLAVNSQRRLKVMHLRASLTQLTPEVVDFFDQRHVLLPNIRHRMQSGGAVFTYASEKWSQSLLHALEARLTDWYFPLPQAVIQLSLSWPHPSRVGKSSTGLPGWG